MYIVNDRLIDLRPYSIGELAHLYEVDYRTLKKWLLPFKKLIGKPIGRYYSIKQVITIFDCVILPCKGMMYNVKENKTIYIGSEKNILNIIPNEPNSNENIL